MSGTCCSVLNRPTLWRKEDFARLLMFTVETPPIAPYRYIRSFMGQKRTALPERLEGTAARCGGWESGERELEHGRARKPGPSLSDRGLQRSAGSRGHWKRPIVVCCSTRTGVLCFSTCLSRRNMIRFFNCFRSVSTQID